MPDARQGFVDGGEESFDRGRILVLRRVPVQKEGEICPAIAHRDAYGEHAHVGKPGAFALPLLASVLTPGSTGMRWM